MTFFLLILLISFSLINAQQSIQTDVPIPEESDGPLCENTGFTIITLMSQETGGTSHCLTLSNYLAASAEMPLDDMCNCFSNPGIDKNFLYTIECRLTAATKYLTNEAGLYCNGDVRLESATDVSAYTKETTTFDYNTWVGVIDNQVGQGQALRKTFTANTGGASDIFYIRTKFTLQQVDTGNPWNTDDLVVVSFGTLNDVEVVYHTPTGADSETHEVIVRVEEYADSVVGEDITYTIGFRSQVNGGEEYTVDVLSTGVYSRKEVAVSCRGTVENPGTTFYPEFVLADSGFRYDYNTSGYPSETFEFVVTMPRYYYNFSIDFDGGNGLAGFSEERLYDENTRVTTANQDAQTFWHVEGTPNEACGDERFIARIPWTVLNIEGGGDLKQREIINTGSEILSNNQSYFFAGVLLMTLNEHVYVSETSNVGMTRSWTPERNLVARVPFAVEMERTVYAMTTMGVVPPLIMINHVAALTEYIQADTIYFPDDITQSFRAFVTMQIKTKTLYPYILVTGQNADDPPIYFENMTDPYESPLDTSSWYPPTVKFTPSRSDVSVATVASFVSEERTSCTFTDASDITVNNNRECEQSWQLTVEPLDGSCYIDGTYEIEYAARCFYDKPTCLFNRNGNGTIINTVVVRLEVESTRMCPELIHEVNIDGRICDTGRDGYELCDNVAVQYDCHDGSNCVGPPHPNFNTYFQGDDIFYFIEASSTDARITYSIIDAIYYTDKANVDPNVPHDPALYQYTLYKEGSAQLLSWTDSSTGITEIVPSVILETQDSNYFASFYSDLGTDRLDLGHFAGFKVFLDERIFPAPTDGYFDAVFTVVLIVTYEGFDGKPTTRRELMELKMPPVEGKKDVTVQTRVQVQRKQIEIKNCETKENMHWVLSTVEDTTILSRDLSSFFPEDSYSILGSVNIGGKTHTSVDIHDDNLWSEMEHTLFFRNRTFQTSSLNDLTQVTCLHVPEGKMTTSLESIQCSLGQPCSIYDSRTLDDYLENGSINDAVVEETDSGFLSVSIIFTILFGFLLL